MPKGIDNINRDCYINNRKYHWEVIKMKKLKLSQLKDLFRWARGQKDRKGRSLLERARESLLKGSYLKYNTAVEISEEAINGYSIIYWDCNCPSATKRNTKKPCKHVFARLILMHEKELSESKRWREWFEEYHNQKMEETLKAFAQF